MRNIKDVIFGIAILLSLTYTLRRGKNPLESKRLLQSSSTTTFGDYVIKKHPDIDKHCTQKGLKEEDLDLSDEDKKSYQDKLNGYYGGIRDPIEKLITQEPNYEITSDIPKFFMWPIITSSLSLLLSIIFFPLLLIWCLCSGWCCKDKRKNSAGCCLKRRKPKEKPSCWVDCTIYSTLIFGLGIVISVFFFLVNGLLTVSKLKFMNCGLSIMFNDITNGVRKDDFLFAGIEGIGYLEGELTTTLDKIAGSSVEKLKIVVDYNLESKGKILKEKMIEIEKTYGELITILPPDEKIGTPLPPASMTLLKESIPTLKPETEIISQVGIDIHQAFNLAYQIADGGTNAVRSGIESGFKAIKDALKKVTDKLNDVKERVLNVFDDEKLKTPASLVIWIFCGVVGGFSIFILVILIMAIFFGKCKILTFSGGKFFTVIEMFCSILINLVAVVLVIVAAVTVNVCYFFDQILNEKEFVSKFSADVAEVIEPCFYGDGSLQTVVGKNPSNSDGVDNLGKLAYGNF